MKKHCGCNDYDKCEHEIAEVGATPKEADSKDGEQEKVEVEKKDRCWDGYEPVPGKKPYEKGSCAPVKKHEEVIDDLMKSWDGPESPCTCGAESLNKAEKPFHGYNPEKHAKTGGLNDKYREKYNRENGSNLQRPSKDKDNPRHKSFCARMKGVKGPTSKDGKPTPKGAALDRWACSKNDAGKSFNELKKEEAKKPKELPESAKRLKSGVSDTGLPYISGSGKDIVELLNHVRPKKQLPTPPPPTKEQTEHAQKMSNLVRDVVDDVLRRNGPIKKHEEVIDDLMKSWDGPKTKVDSSDSLKKGGGLMGAANPFYRGPAEQAPPPPPPPPKEETGIAAGINRAAARGGTSPSEVASASRSGFGKKENKKSGKKSLEKGGVKNISKPKNAAEIKTDLASPAGKKYEEMSYGELSSHVAGLFGGKKKEEKPKKSPGALAASESARELEKGDVIDLKTKQKTPGPKAVSPAKKPDTRSRDQKINDALASQGVKTSEPKKPINLSHALEGHEMDEVKKPKDKPTTGRELRREKFLEDYKQKQRQDSQNFINNILPANKPKSPAGLKIVKSLEAIMPKFEQGMSMEDLKKAEEKYNLIKSKIESLIETGNTELIEKAIEKLKNI